jgi:hypothetical protein
MSKSHLMIAAVLSVVLIVLSACGGGGQGLRADANPVLVTSTSLPPMLSGQGMDHVIPLEGGCGGPYVLQVIAGKMPLGLTLDNDTHAIRGSILEDGVFDFTIQVTDAGCDPFSSTRASFHMEVGVGAITVVGATRDGNPAFFPAGAQDYNPDHPALGDVVYNEYVTLELIVAGGHGPYSAVLADDPDIANDGPLPLGAGIPPGSASITGAPVQVGPGGGPFLVTLEITDSTGGKGRFTCYWLVETPPIVFATDSIRDGQTGTTYSDQIFVAEGVPPFVFELVEVGLPADYTSDKSTNPALDPATDVIYNPGAPPTVTPPGALVKIDASVYPSQTDLGPGYAVSHQGAPSEGIVMYEATGSLSGIARRRGSFSINVHVMSSLVPNSFGQHAWGTLGYQIAGGPAIVHNPAYTLDGAFTATPPYARIAEAQKDQVYNPDGGPLGLQIRATGGVPEDGITDAPHGSQVAPAPGETNGAYAWTMDWDPDGEGNLPVPEMEFLASGVLRVAAGREGYLVPQFDQALSFTASDSALPIQYASTRTEKVTFSVGPDKIIITQSSTSFTTGYDNRAANDTAMTLKIMTPNPATGDVIRSPGTTDLPGSGTDRIGLPAEAGSGTTLATLLTSMDLCRVSVNPTGWWDDLHHLNPRAARPFQDGDGNACYAYYGVGSWGTTSYTANSTSSYQYQYQPTGLSVRLPVCTDTGVTQNTNLGVYTNGGKLHVFDSSAYLGIFIIRKDGRIYVPAAFQKSSSGYVSFGDNWTDGYTSSSGQLNSINKLPQMTVSPDGRFAAFKLRTSTSFDQYETANTTSILLISLTGERISAWGGEVYKIIDSGSSGSTSTGQYLFASSLTLTNGYLYYLIGSGSSTYLHFKDHYVYRYDLFGGDDEGSLLHSNFNSEWTNSSGNAMQTPYQCFGRSFAAYNGPDVTMVGTHGHNAYENSLAPHPFRVNSQGNACAILAGVTTGSTTSGSDVYLHHVWVDYEGDFHQLSSQRRHTTGAGRGFSLNGGPADAPVAYLWGAYNGPTSQFEISDDGLKVAVAYYRGSTAYGYATYSTQPTRYREDIAAYVSTSTAPWGTFATHEITGDSGTSTAPSGVFSSSAGIVWRFGTLTFTTEGDGLVFWGGYSNWGPTTTAMLYTYQEYGAKSYVGSLYSYDFAGGNVRNILGSTDGGCNKTVGSAQTSISFSTSSWGLDGGVIKPIGGFRSMNGDFLYLITRGAVNTSDYRDSTLIAANVRSLNTGQSINGRTDGRAYRPSGFHTYNGFYPTQYYLGALGWSTYSYSSLYNQYYVQMGDTQTAASTDNGWVFFTSVTASGSASVYQYNYYGGCVLSTYYAYPYQPKKIYVFDPNVGGDVNELAASGWTGASYQMVGGLIASDDGTALMAIDSTAIYYNWNNQERLSLFSGIELDGSGDLVGSPVRETFESSGYVSSHVAFSPKLDSIFYAQGSSNENGKSLKRGTTNSNATKSTYSFTAANYNVLHAGR